MTDALDFPALFPYNTTIGNDGTKYPGQMRLKRAFGGWKKAAAAPANTSPSPAVNVFPVADRRCAVYSAGPAWPAEGAFAPKRKWYRDFSVAFLPKREGGGFPFSRPERSGKCKGGVFMDSVSYARRFDNVTGSAIREIFKVLGRPGMISFAGGNPSLDALPDQLCADLARDALLADGKRILQYGATEGYPPFLEPLSEYLKSHFGFSMDGDDVLPTTGSTSGMDLLLKALVNPGDAVLVESPTFLGNMQTMHLYEANLIPIESDEGGVKLDALEEAARRYHPRLFYVIPTFQNPSGRTLAADRRKAIAELAAKYGFIVAEDDPYRDLRYRGESLPPIKSYDTTGHVVYLGSFSKLVSPGLRVGYLLAGQELLRKCTIGKQGTDLHTPNLNQAIIDQFLRRDLLDSHIQSIIPGYREKLELMLGELASFPEGTRYTAPEGGLFIFVEMPEGFDATALFSEAVERGVAYVPGTHFYPDGGHHNTLRLNFSNSTPQQIHEGMGKLRELFAAHLG